MKRSVGLIFAAIALGAVAWGMALFAGLMVVAGVSLRTHPPSPPPPIFVNWFGYAATAVLATLAAWAMTMVIGLLFIRSWARYSVLVLGGLLAAVGGLSLFGVAVSLFAGPMMFPTPHPGVSDHAIHIVLGFTAVFYGWLRQSACGG